jgi:hypothetical protein
LSYWVWAELSEAPLNQLSAFNQPKIGNIPKTLGVNVTVQPSLRAALKRLVENPHLSVKRRLAAFARLQQLGASTAMLEHLLRDRNLPTRLLAEVCVCYDAKQTIQNWKREQKKAANSSVLGTFSD